MLINRENGRPSSLPSPVLLLFIILDPQKIKMNQTSKSKQFFASTQLADTFVLPSMNILLGGRKAKGGSGKKSRLNPIFFQRWRLSAPIDSQPEPCSPRVTCNGHVKVKAKSKNKESRRWITDCCKLGRTLKKCQSLFESGCFWSASGSNFNRRDDRVQKQGEAEGAKCESLPAGSPTTLLTRCRAASSVGARLWSSSSSSPYALRCETRKDVATSGSEAMRGDSESMEEDSESLKHGENRGSDLAGESDVDTTTSKAEAVDMMLRRCNSGPGGIRRRFVSDPDMEIGRRRFGF